VSKQGEPRRGLPLTSRIPSSDEEVRC
jgi:hypothetical protein